MSHTLFTLGFPTTTAPWSYQHSLGISTKEVVDWWKTAETKVDTAINEANAAGLGPSNAPATPPRPVAPPPPPPSGGSSGTILVGLLVVGAAAGGLFYYKSKQGRFPWEKNGKGKAKAS